MYYVGPLVNVEAKNIFLRAAPYSHHRNPTEQIGDTPHGRYIKAKRIAEAFGIIQVGICTFDRYGVARPFNFYVFPRPLKEPPYYCSFFIIMY